MPRPLAVALLAVVAAAPAAFAPAALAQGAGQATPGISAAARAVPAQVPVEARAAWRAVFDDLRAGRTEAALARARLLPASPLTAHVEAEAILARGPERAQIADPAAWLAQNADLPQAARIAQRLGLGGATTLPAPRELRWVNLGRPPERARSHGDALERAVEGHVAGDRPAEAEAGWRRHAETAPEGSRTLWAQRIAWTYYRLDDDAGARRMGEESARGSGGFAGLGAWTAGLAAWRQGDCEAASRYFDMVAPKGPSDDLASAGLYWAHRAHLACGRPAEATRRLERARAFEHSFYGLLARRALGIDSRLDWSEPDFIRADWNQLEGLPGARRAAALVEIGQLGLADRELRHLASIADPQRYQAILRLAARLSLPATQLWLAQRSPNGVPAPLAARFPAPDWRPARGWRVDQALVFAHALQESQFITDAVSSAGARGVMQLMPGTSAQLARQMGETSSAERLRDPSFNIEMGQTYLEELRDGGWTLGLLPKVIAAYNAGPGSVQRWRSGLRYNGDPLLYIESIPFRETRQYVEIVLRNYWMYQMREGKDPVSMTAIASNLWPRFPNMPGPQMVRLNRAGAIDMAQGAAAPAAASPAPASPALPAVTQVSGSASLGSGRP
jgi:soluble lytic murein transglycosylase-like protein